MAESPYPRKLHPNTNIYLLLPGTWCGGWSWRPVTQALRAAGHKVYTPSLTGLAEHCHQARFQPGLEAHIMDIFNFIKYYELQDIILVCHSYSGMPAMGAMDRLPPGVIRQAFFVDALFPRSGECSLDLLSPEQYTNILAPLMDIEQGVIHPPTLSPRSFIDPRMIAWFQQQMTPHPLRTYLDHIQLQHTQGNGIPATYLACSFTKLSAMRRSAQRAAAHPGWRTIYCTAPHNIALSNPAFMTQMLLEYV